jgi:hypothetical protein
MSNPEIIDEVIEMEEGKDGKFYDVIVSKRNPPPPPPAHIHPNIPRRLSAFYELIDGFAMGLGAIENFIVNVNRMGKKKPGSRFP